MNTPAPLVADSAPDEDPARARVPVEELNQMLYDVRQDLAFENRYHQVLSRELKAAQKELAKRSKAASSFSFRLGKLLTRALRSPGALARLPADVWALRAEMRAAKARKAKV